jgi:hypothetical protein
MYSGSVEFKALTAVIMKNSILAYSLTLKEEVLKCWLTLTTLHDIISKQIELFMYAIKLFIFPSINIRWQYTIITCI